MSRRDAPPALETIELLADDANCKVRRVRRLDEIERAFRRGARGGGWIGDQHYRIARCLEIDFQASLPPSGGMRLERIRESAALRREEGEYFAMMPGAPGVSTIAPQARAEEAQERLRHAEKVVGKTAIAMLRMWAGEGHTRRELERRFRRRNQWATGAIKVALEAIDAAKIYENEKWNVMVMAEAV